MKGLLQSATQKTGPATTACNSAPNTSATDVAKRLVRVTHPFHPLKDQKLVCVGERHNRYGTRLLLSIDKDAICSVPRQWTDLASPDPEIVLGQERALFCVADLIELERLVNHLAKRYGPGESACDA